MTPAKKIRNSPPAQTDDRPAPQAASGTDAVVPDTAATLAPATAATAATAAKRRSVQTGRAAANRSTPAAPDSAQPDYWKEACRHLVKKDRVLRRIIPQYSGGIGLQSRGDAFATLARSIVGQQISTSAAAAVWARVEQTVPAPFGPPALLALNTDTLRGCGLSMRKTEYLRDLALHFEEQRLNVTEWPQWDDEAIITELTAVRGIGRWTAEMFLMFHLLRPNVLPLDDLGLIQGISRNYFSGEPVSRSDAREVAEAWKPWRTVGTWYMWRSLAAPQAY